MRRWTDPAGAVLAAQSYGPFGEARDDLSTPPWGFTGEWQDPAGMVYLRARWYNPTLGRFTQVDPVGGQLTAPATQHAYAYGLNNPLTYSDPDGRWPKDPETALDSLYLAWNIGAAIGTGLQMLVYGRTEARVGRFNAQLAAVAMSAIALAVPGTTAAGPRVQGNGSAATLVYETAASPEVAKALARVGQAYVLYLLAKAKPCGSSGSSRGLPDAQAEIDKWKVNKNLPRGDDYHLDAVRRARKGEKELEGHIPEVDSARRGLNTALKRIEGALQDPNWTAEARESFSQQQEIIQEVIRRMTSALYGPLD